MNWLKVYEVLEEIFVQSRVYFLKVTERIREFLGIYYHTLILLQRCIKHKVCVFVLNDKKKTS